MQRLSSSKGPTLVSVQGSYRTPSRVAILIPSDGVRAPLELDFQFVGVGVLLRVQMLIMRSRWCAGVDEGLTGMLVCRGGGGEAQGDQYAGTSDSVGCLGLQLSYQLAWLASTAGLQAVISKRVEYSPGPSDAQVEGHLIWRIQVEGGYSVSITVMYSRTHSTR